MTEDQVRKALEARDSLTDAILSRCKKVPHGVAADMCVAVGQLTVAAIQADPDALDTEEAVKACFEILGGLVVIIRKHEVATSTPSQETQS